MSSTKADYQRVDNGEKKQKKEPFVFAYGNIEFPINLGILILAAIKVFYDFWILNQRARKEFDIKGLCEGYFGYYKVCWICRE